MIKKIMLAIALTIVAATAGCGNKSSDVVIPTGMKVTNMTQAQITAGQAIIEARRAHRQASN